MLRVSQENDCSFYGSDALEMFDKPVKKGLVKLLELKRLVELEELMIPNTVSITGSSITHRKVHRIQGTSSTTCKGRKNHIRQRRC